MHTIEKRISDEETVRDRADRDIREKLDKCIRFTQAVGTEFYPIYIEQTGSNPNTYAFA